MSSSLRAKSCCTRIATAVTSEGTQKALERYSCLSRFNFEISLKLPQTFQDPAKLRQILSHVLQTPWISIKARYFVFHMLWEGRVENIPNFGQLSGKSNHAKKETSILWTEWFRKRYSFQKTELLVERTDHSSWHYGASLRRDEKLWSTWNILDVSQSLLVRTTEPLGSQGWYLGNVTLGILHDIELDPNNNTFQCYKWE